MPDKLNFIICMADQLRASALGCYGDPVIRTPHIDALAAEGLRFEHAITPRPVCMAARSALLSGQYPRRCTGGVGNIGFQMREGSFDMPEYPYDDRPHLKEPTLPELLRGEGYHTAAIGKWHVHSWPHDIGFDHYVIPRVHHAHSSQLFIEDGGEEFAAPGYSVDYEVDRVGGYLRDRAQQNEPFFLYYNISPPHCPVADGPEHYLAMYRPDDVPIRPNVDLSNPGPDPDYWYRVYRWDYRYYQHHLPHTMDLPEGYGLKHLIAEYYGMTTWVDDAVGRMVQHVRDAGLADNTVIVFTADHGDSLGSHSRWQKGTFNDESVGVPFVVRMPGGAAATVNSEQVACLVDLMPTLLDLAGAPQPDHTHGQSLARLWRGETSHTDRPYAFSEGGSNCCVRTPTHTYELRYEDRQTLVDTPAFFVDNAADPYQMHNMAGTNEQADTARELDTLLRNWHRSTPWMVED